MLTRGWRCLFGMLILLASCTSPLPSAVSENETPSPTPAASPPAGEQPSIALLPSSCDIGAAFREKHRITFVKDGRLFATSQAGQDTVCLQEAPDARRLAWGPRTDRFYLSNSANHTIVRALGAQQAHRIPRDARDLTWSHPKGTSLVYISRDGSKLLKRSAHGGPAEDISFLDDHTAVTYHPAGTHIAVSGRRADAGYGIWLATNIGTDPQLLARGEDAENIDELAFTSAGQTLFFAATHTQPRRRHVHALGLEANERDGAGLVAEGDLRTPFRGRKITALAVSPFSSLNVAVTTHCDRPSTYLLKRKPKPLAGTLGARVTTPVGWLQNRRLILIAFDERCDEPTGDLYVLGTGGVAKLLAEDVQTAAVRVAFPSAPDAPGTPREVVA